jgi:hypothetical protein
MHTQTLESFGDELEKIALNIGNATTTAMRAARVGDPRAIRVAGRLAARYGEGGAAGAKMIGASFRPASLSPGP